MLHITQLVENVYAVKKQHIPFQYELRVPNLRKNHAIFKTIAPDPLPRKGFFDGH